MRYAFFLLLQLIFLGVAFVVPVGEVLAATCSLSPNTIPSGKDTSVNLVWSGLNKDKSYSLLCGNSSEALLVLSYSPNGSQGITMKGANYSVGQHSCFLERTEDSATECTAAFTVTSSGSANTCTSSCGTGGTCSCVKDTSCVSPKTTVSAGSSYCASQLTDGVCCKTSTTTTTCTGGTCRATCPSGEFSDSTCSSSSCSSSSASLFCRSCSGTSHSCVGASSSCPSGTTATPACDNNATACPTTSQQKYCVTSSAIGGGSGTSTAKCDPTKFEEYAGVCFPIGTGLSKTSVADIILNLMKWMLYLFGFLAIIAFVISGIQYLSAAGNMNMIETAKRNMNYSIIGIIVALSGLVILVAIDALLRGTGWGG